MEVLWGMPSGGSCACRAPAEGAWGQLLTGCFAWWTPPDLFLLAGAGVGVIGGCDWGVSGLLSRVHCMVCALFWMLLVAADEHHNILPNLKDNSLRITPSYLHQMLKPLAAMDLGHLVPLSL
jgi:hypothetical protein